MGWSLIIVSLMGLAAPNLRDHVGPGEHFKQFEILLPSIRFNGSIGGDAPDGRARSAARRGKLDAEFHSRLGEPAPAIARFARDARCTEIIMGTRGRSRMASFVLGSVAMKVVQLAAIPVTLVK